MATRYAELRHTLDLIVTEFDDEVSTVLAGDSGERADLWTDVDVPIGIVREAAAAITALEAEVRSVEEGMTAADFFIEGKLELQEAVAQRDKLAEALAALVAESDDTDTSAFAVALDSARAALASIESKP